MSNLALKLQLRAVQHIVDDLVLEAKRVGKIPWTCDSTIQGMLCDRLGWDSPEETMEETIARRKQEAMHIKHSVQTHNFGEFSFMLDTFQTVSDGVIEGLTEKIATQIVDLQEQAIRDGLVKLGWTPPQPVPAEKPLNQVAYEAFDATIRPKSSVAWNEVPIIQQKAWLAVTVAVVNAYQNGGKAGYVRPELDMGSTP